MIDPATFFKGVGIFILIISLFGGMIFWMIYLFRKIAPDFKYWFKYNVLNKKYNEKDVERLLDYHQAGWSIVQVKKFLLINGFSMDRAREFCFIYKQIQRKGGKKNE